MELTKGKIVLIGIAVLLSGAMSLYINSYNKNIEEQVRVMEGGGPLWNAEKAQEDLDQAAARFDDAATAIARHDYDTIYRAYRDAHYLADAWARTHADEELEDGVTIGAWVEQRESAFREAMFGELDAMIAELESGQASWPQFKQMLTNFSADFRALEDAFEERKQDVVLARSKAAPNWFRVTFGGYTYQYENTLYPLLRDHWNADYDKQLVLGYAMDKPEEQTTWKSMYVNVDQQAETYSRQDQPNQSFTFPYKVTLTFEVEGAEGVPTTWDDLPPIVAEADLPESIMVEVDRFDDHITSSGHATMRTMEQEAFDEILSQLKSKMAAIPEFELYPGVDPASVEIVQGGRVDPDALRMLGYLDPDRLARELDRLTRGDAPAGMEEVPAILVELDVHGAADWVVDQMAAMDDQTERRFVEALARRPWFGDYRAAAALVDNFDGQWPYDSQKIFESHLDQPAIQKAFMAKIDELEDYARQNLIQMFLYAVPLEDVENKLDAWMRSEDRDFATTVYSAVSRRDKTQAQRLALANFDYVPEDVQRNALRSLDVFEGADNARESFDLIVKVLASTTSDEVRSTCYEKVFAAARQDYGWDALQRIYIDESDPEMRQRIQETLIRNVQNAHPDTSEDYLYDLLLNGSPNPQALATHELIRSDAETQFLTDSIVFCMQDHPEPEQVVRQALMAIYQERKLERGWDYENDSNFEQILLAGLKHENRGTRSNAYYTLAYALSEGFEKYRQPLMDALDAEPEDDLERTIRGLPELQ